MNIEVVRRILKRYCKENLKGIKYELISNPEFNYFSDAIINRDGYDSVFENGLEIRFDFDKYYWNSIIFTDAKTKHGLRLVNGYGSVAYFLPTLERNIEICEKPMVVYHFRKIYSQTRLEDHLSDIFKDSRVMLHHTLVQQGLPSQLDELMKGYNS